MAVTTSVQGQRQLRVGEQIRQALVEALQQGHFLDPELNDARLVTVAEVKISPDLKNATAFVMPLGGKDQEVVIPALNRASSYFRKEVGYRLKMRFTPRIHFVPDTSFSYAQHIETLLNDEEVQKDLKKSNDEENISE